MNLTLVNLPVTNLNQIEAIVPSIVDNYTFIPPSTISINDTVYAALSPAEIADIQNYQFDPCLAYGQYNPILLNQQIRNFDAINLILTPIVGTPPPDVGTYDFCVSRNGIDTNGNVRPLNQWRSEPSAWTMFRASPCYVP